MTKVPGWKLPANWRVCTFDEVGKSDTPEYIRRDGLAKVYWTLPGFWQGWIRNVDSHPWDYATSGFDIQEIIARTECALNETFNVWSRLYPNKVD